MGFYPFFIGKLNNEDEFRLRSGQTNNLGIGYGLKALFIPFGLTRNTWHFFNPDDAETKLFIQKNNVLKNKLKTQYSIAAMSATLKKIQIQNVDYVHQIDSLRKNNVSDVELKIIALEEKINENRTKDLLLNQYLNDNSTLKDFIDNSIYQVEKDAPWTTRHFVWFTLDYSGNAQNANIFRNKIIEKDQTFRNNAIGVSVNYSFLKPKSIINTFVKYEISTTNKFLGDYDAITFVEDSVIVGTKYKTSKFIEAYDISKLNDTQFNEQSNKRILTLGATYLRGKDKKNGLTANYRTDLEKNIANLKVGIIIPVILDNAKAAQSNLIFEYALPDLYSNSTSNIGKGESAFKRAYINIKIGIPINAL